MVPKIVAHVAFAHAHLDRVIAALDLDPTLARVVRDQLVSGLYLLHFASAATAPDVRRRMNDRGACLLARARTPGGPLARLSAEEGSLIEHAAVAGHFCRATSCVGGRNGRLALHRHGLRRNSPERLRALTILHNFDNRRLDGSAPASRFFGADHADPFEAVLAQLDPLPRPRASRRRAA